MRKILFYSLLLGFLIACKDRSGSEPDPSPGAVTLPNDIQEPATAASSEPDSGSSITAAPEPKYKDNRSSLDALPEELNAFIPDGYAALGYEYGDLNRDRQKKDAILVLKDKKEDELDANRPLLILTRQPDGSLKQVARNDHVVLCYGCGGVMGDPFQGIAIKNAYFSIEHFGGSRYKWTNIITFKYDKVKQGWYLHKIGDESYDGFNPDSVSTDIKTTTDFGQIRFEDFTADNIIQ